MRIIFYSPDNHIQAWLDGFTALMPEAQLHVWREGDERAAAIAADYAILWRPPAALLQGRSDLKAIFNLGAGVDAILKLGSALPANVPIIRLDDAGMGVQMAEYVSHAVLRYMRRFDEYELQRSSKQWQFLPPHEKQDFTVGILGIGVLGKRIAAALAQFELPVRSWSRNPKSLPGITCFDGTDGLDQFLSGTRVLVCALPLTSDTENILDRATLSKLPRGAYLINVARGGHLAEAELLALIRSGHIAGATLDVFRHEPLPQQHPFWDEPRITITPHMAATTLRNDSIPQIVGKIRALERGEAVAGVVDRDAGY
ncbi:MAG: glyoxylate/hydroxypyruvate reductase A [Pseudomonadota bacterium]